MFGVSFVSERKYVPTHCWLVLYVGGSNIPLSIRSRKHSFISLVSCFGTHLTKTSVLEQFMNDVMLQAMTNLQISSHLIDYYSRFSSVIRSNFRFRIGPNSSVRPPGTRLIRQFEIALLYFLCHSYTC